jgi:Flp pilus assembly protein CpaB
VEAVSTRNKLGKRSPGDLLSTRGGAITVAVVTAIVAGVLLFAFVQRYRSNSNSANAPTPVFVARALIPQGTSADLIASEQLVQRTTLRGSQVQAGAIADPGVLHGEVAAGNIYPGQQLTAAAFTRAATISSDLASNERAIAIPVDGAHGLVGFVRAGDRVDVLADIGGRAVATLLQNVLVLSPPAAGGGGLGGSGGGASNIVLKVPSQTATQVAFAADSGKVWIILRPPPTATQSGQSGQPGASGNTPAPGTP